jgi:hypothetical protein
MTSRTRAVTPAAVKQRIRRLFSRHLGGAAGRRILGEMVYYDRAYELSCMVEVMSRLKSQFGHLDCVLSRGTSVEFRSKGGKLERGRWPHVELRLPDHGTIGEIWTNVEFRSLSAARTSRVVRHPPYGDAHELDVVVLRPGLPDGYPNPEDIQVGVEAKHRPYTKALLKELLGVRREMAFVSPPRQNPFVWWTATVPASPPSGLIGYCSDVDVARYAGSTAFYGVELEHRP